MDPLGLTRITYDVASGRLTIDPEKSGANPYSVNATSGKDQCQNKPPCESKPYEGPIPRGEYFSDTSEISNPGPIGDIARLLRGGRDWGDWRVPIHPLPGTNTFGRKGFFLHGGMFSGSAGCIDAGGGLFGDEITDQILRDLLSDPDGSIPITVR